MTDTERYIKETISTIVNKHMEAAAEEIYLKLTERFKNVKNFMVSSEPLEPLCIEEYAPNKFMGYCPSCSHNDGGIKHPVFYNEQYCSNCSQPLDWSSVSKYRNKENEVLARAGIFNI